MITRFDPPETIVQLRKVDKRGEDTNYEDCTAGIQVMEGGKELQIDLRNLRPMRINDRESLILALELDDVLMAIAESIKDRVKDE